MPLLLKLNKIYPDWRKFHNTPTEAAVECGLLDEDDLALEDVPELDFNKELDHD